MQQKKSGSHLSKAVFDAQLQLLASQTWLVPRSAKLQALISACPSDNHRLMIIELLGRATYVSGNDYFDTIDKLRDRVERTWLLHPSDTIFVSSNDSFHTDSSQEVLNQMKSAGWHGAGWKKTHFYVNYRFAAKSISSGGTIVIVDDFIGSGGSMLKTLAWFQAEMIVQNKKFYLKILAVAGCSEGVGAVIHAGHDLYCPIIVKRGLTAHLSGNALADATSLMKQLEKNLEKFVKNKRRFRDFTMGWGRQEAVYVRQGGNTPNNVFPIFWWDCYPGGKATTIMHRT